MQEKNGTGKVETAASDTLSFSNDAYKMRTFLESYAEKIVFFKFNMTKHSLRCCDTASLSFN